MRTAPCAGGSTRWGACSARPRKNRQGGAGRGPPMSSEPRPAESVCLAGVVEAGKETASAEIVAVPGLSALVTKSGAAELDDPELLEQRVRAHNELLLEALERGPVVPIRFGTFFPSTAAVADWLERNEQPLRRELDRLRDTTEWALCIVEAEPALAAASAVPAAPESYLERRMAEGEEAARQRRLRAGRAEAWHEQLAPLAVASSSSGERPGVLLEAAYLVR